MFSDIVSPLHNTICLLSKTLAHPVRIGPLLPNMQNFIGENAVEPVAWMPFDLQETLKTRMSEATDAMINILFGSRTMVTAFAKWRVESSMTGGAVDKAQMQSVFRTWSRIFHEYDDMDDDEKITLDAFVRDKAVVKYRKEQLLGCVCIRFASLFD